MSIKTRFYHKLRNIASTKYGISLMLIICFLESCISPITPLVMLIPMVLLHKDNAMYYVNIATLAAVLGSILGYFLGHFLMDLLEPFIYSWGFTEEFIKVKAWFAKYGLLTLLPASILPFPPFKLFTIGAGAMELSFIPFIIVVFIVRWLHFVLIPILIKVGKSAYLIKYENKMTVD